MFGVQVAGAGANVDAGSVRRATRPSSPDGSLLDDGAHAAEVIKADGLRKTKVVPTMHSDAKTPYIEALARDALQRFDEISTSASHKRRPRRPPHFE